MTKIIWMSDPHFLPTGTIDGLDPRARLSAAIDHANTHHQDADFAIISGDLMHDDTAADYPEIAKYLGTSKIPIHPMMGNNDDRDAMRTSLPLPTSLTPDFIQYALDTPDALILCLDTHKIGSAAGEMCDARLAWLDTALSGATKPVYIFMHHPPLALGLPPQDAIKLDNADRFLNLIARHTNVQHLFMGHVHRTTNGTVRGIPFTTLGALSFQAPAPRPAWDWDTFKAPREAPHYAIIHINDDSVVLHHIQFCDANFAEQTA